MNIGDYINSAVAIATALMAIFTYNLARLTRKLAAETMEGIRQTERHHQENLRPFCVLNIDEFDDVHPFGFDFDPKDREGKIRIASDTVARRLPPPPKDAISIRGSLSNKGMGLAKSVVVFLNKRT